MPTPKNAVCAIRIACPVCNVGPHQRCVTKSRKKKRKRHTARK